MCAIAVCPVGRSGKSAMHFGLSDRSIADRTSISPRTICASSESAVRLAASIGSAAGFGAAPKIVAEKVWRLGNTPSGRTVFLALEPAALTGDGIAAVLRQAAQGVAITILAPELPAVAARRHHDAGFHLIETLSVLKPASNGFDVAIDVAALAPVPLAPVLRVRTATAEVQWGNRSVILSHQMFPVFERLLEKARSRDHVAFRSYVGGTTAREAKDLVRELRDAFKAAGITDTESKALIVTVRGRGYHLDVPAATIMADV